LDNRLDRSRHTSERSALAGRQRRCFAIREGTDQVIDMLRRGYDELLQDTQETAEEDKKELPQARLIFTANRGFHFSIPFADPVAKVELPDHFIEVARHRASISFTTRSLVRYNGICSLIFIFYIKAVRFVV
uniref:MutS_IV domain-containing protein n=1 Tax=Gongylonema pulchrum TaxID=637853 RepID=A0A183EQJ1_9BILA